MTYFCEYFCYSFIGLIHKVIQDKEGSFLSIENFQIWQSFLKLYLGVSIEYVLVYSETPHYFFDSWNHHMLQVIYKFLCKLGLSTSRGPADYGTKWMSPGRIHFTE